MKRVFRIVLIFSIIAAILLPAAVMAQASRKDIHVAVLIQRGLKEKDVASGDKTALGNVLHSLANIYPEYVNVTFDFFRVDNIRTVNSNGNIWPITSCGKNDEWFSSSIDNLLVTASSMTKPAQTYKNMDEMLSRYTGSSNRLLIVGSYNASNYLATDKFPADVPVFLLNTSDAETGIAPFEMLLEAGHELETACQIYSVYDSDAYYQTLYTFQTEDYICTVEGSTDTADVIGRRILVDTTVDQESLDSSLKLIQPSAGLTVISSDSGKTIDFRPASKANGKVTVVVTSQRQPYTFTVEQSTGEILNRNMSERIDLSASFVQKDDSLSAFRFDPSEWQITAETTNQKGTHGITLNSVGMEFSGSFSCEELGPGAGTITVEARNMAEPFLSREPVLIPYEITNTAPVFNGNPKVNLYVWDNMPIDISGDLTIRIDDFYSDDGGTDRLEYSTSGCFEDLVSIYNETYEGNEVATILKLDRTKIKENGELNVIAKDKADLENNQLTIAVIYQDVIESLKTGEAPIIMKVNGNTDTSAFKDSTVDGSFAYTIPDGLKPYIDELKTKDLISSISDLLAVRATINGKEVSAGLEESEYGINVSVFGGDSRISDNIQMEAEVALKDSGIVLATYRGSLTVANRIPEYKKEFLAHTAYDLCVPGPFFLNQDKQPEQVTLKLDEILNTEKLDVITFIPSSETGACLYKEADECYIMTDAVLETETVDSIIWNTEETAPQLIIKPTKRGDEKVTITVRDDNGASPKDDPVMLTLTVRYYDEQKIIFITGAVLGVILLLVLIMVIRQILKPSFAEGDKLHIQYGAFETDISLTKWKKKGLTLRDVLIYGGIPIVGDIPLKECEKTMIMPGRKAYSAEIRRQGKWTIGITVNGAEQTRKKVKVHTGTIAEVHIAEGKDILLSGT